MVESKINNMFYINAPAGSGKTTSIEKKILDIMQTNPESNILCITYTNRASNELCRKIQAENVYIGTIHSFINFFIKPYFNFQESIDMYCEIFKSQIIERIEENYKNNNGKNEEYLSEKKIMVTEDILLAYETIKNHMTHIYYNERDYDSVFFGGLSHDSLLMFAMKMLEKYPILQLKLQEKYSHIFIDECQDTSSDILNLFFSATIGTKTQLLLYGDKMQEIYDNYNGDFEEQYSMMCNSIKLNENYRSSEEIVTLLNNLYKVEGYRQESSRKKTGIAPKLVICNSIDEYLNKNLQVLENHLKLRVHNRKRFERAEPEDTMSNIFNETSSLYPYSSKISAIDVLMPDIPVENSDELLQFLFLMDELLENFIQNKFSLVIQVIRKTQYSHMGINKKIFNQEQLDVKFHMDKIRLQSLLSKAHENYEKANLELSYTILDYIDFLKDKNFIREDFHAYISSLEKNISATDILTYENLLNVPLYQFRNLVEYIENPKISTQHGVKGEGHEQVCFVAEDSTRNRPYLYMYRFFEIFSKLEEFNLNNFQEFAYTFSHNIKAIENNHGKKLSEFKKPDFEEIDCVLSDYLVSIADNIYFKYFFAESYVAFLKNREDEKVVAKVSKELVSYTTVNRTLTAYKLFYVGCSRAKDELIVLVDSSGISKFREEFTTKMEQIGFSVEDEE